MTKLSKPLLSLDASGSLGDEVLISHRHHRAIAERKAQPVDVKTLAQLSWRHMYQKAIALWHALSPTEKVEWESAARRQRMTGYAWFISQCLRPNPGLYLPLQGGTMQGDIDMDSNLIINLPDPTNPQDADTMNARDLAIEAAKYKQSARVYNNANISTPTGAFIEVPFNSERWDTDNIHSTIANTGRLVCNTPGLYLITANIAWFANANGYRSLLLYLNDTTYIGRYQTNAVNGSYSALAVSTQWRLNADDYVTLVSVQTSGGNLSIWYLPAYSPEFMISRIGDL